MTTLTQKIAELEKQTAKEEPQAKPTPSNFIYPVRSGSKDIKTRFTIGGKYPEKKKDTKPSQPIFGASPKSLEDKEVATSTKEAVIRVPGILNLSTLPKIFNRDVQNTLPKKDIVIGMQKMGGKGTWSASGAINKLEEMKLLKGIFKPGGMENRPKKGGTW